MNRNLLSSLFALVLLFLSQGMKAQAFQATCNPNYIFANTGCIQCFNPNGNTGGAGVVAFPPSATTYTWIIQTPTSCTTPATHTCQGTDCSSITLSYACCGIYTINSVAINGTLSPPQPVAQSVIFQTVVCSTNASVNVAQPTICIGSGGTALTASGAQTYTWFAPGGVNLGSANPIVVSPTANTCYTVIGTTNEGCTVTASGCVAVQSASLSVSPASQTMCLGSQVCFTATGGAINNASVTPNTGTTGIQWYDPNGNLFSNSFITCTTAIGGNYTAILTHTGAAGGTCSVTALAAVAIGTNINVSINIAPSTSVCPGNNVTLTAVSIATAAGQHTWTSSGGMIPLNGKSVVVNPTANTTYTVNVDYFGCPGTATIAVGMLTLTPNITASSPSICPGTDFTMTASGGTTYTWYYTDPNPPFAGTVIGTPNTSSNSIAHTPSLGLPGTYSVMAFGGGCSGAAFFTVQEYSLYPTLTASSPSICPGTNFTMTAGNVGGTPNYTFMAGYPASSFTPNTIITTGTANPIVHNPGTNTLAQTYTVYADSAGCTGEAQVTVNLMVLNPTLSLLGNTTGSVCPGTEFTLSSTGGAGTTYTFYTTPNVAIGTPTNTQNFAAHQPTSLPRNYWVKTDSVGCKGGDTIQVGVLNLSPKVSLLVTNQNGTVFTAANPSVCPNTIFTLNVMGVGTGSTTSFTITAPVGGTVVPFQTASSATHAISASNFNATYTVAADSAGCIGTNTLQVRRLTLNTQVIATPSVVCAGMPVTVCATGGSNTIYNYFYVVGTTSTQLAVNTASSCTVHSNPGPTTQIVYVAYADSAGCTGFNTTLVNIAPGLVLNATASTPTVCSGSAVTLSVTGPANASYSWAAVVGTLSTPLTGMLPYATASAGVTDNPTVTTTYVVTGLDPAGCTGTAAITVSINPTASLSLVVGPQNPTICPGQSATLSVSGTSSYTWSPAGSLSPSAFVPTVTASPSITTVYTVVGTNNAGCYGAATLTLTVNQFPVLTFAATAYSVCAGFTSTITAFGAQSYTWTGSTFTNAIAQQSIAVGNGCFTVTGSNGGTCIKSNSICIGVAPPLNIQITATPGQQTTCIISNNPKFSKPVKLTASGASSYVWLPYNPLVMTYSLGATTTVRPPASTCYTVIGATSICSSQQTICITVIPQFTMNVVPPLPAMCIGDSLNLKIVNIDMTKAVGPVSALTYSWTEAQNAPPISISPSNLNPTVMVFPQNTTTYTVEVFDSRKCVSVPRLVTVTVFPMPVTAVAIPTINNIPTNTVCFVGDNPGPPDVVLNLLAENKNTNLQFGIVPTYTWVSPYPKEYNSILTPPNNPGITVSAPLRLPSLVTYTVYSGYNGIPGCRVMDTVSVRVIDCRPVRGVKFTTAEPNDTICARDCITFINLTDTMAGGPQQVEWTFPGGNPPKSNEPNPTVCYNLPSERGYNVILKVSNPYPLQDAGSSAISGFLQYVKVVDVPNITIIPPGQLRSDTVIRFGTEVKLNASGGKSYNWSPNYNISSNTASNVTVKPFRTTQYVLTGYNSKNCASSDTINVIVIEDCGEMYVPNAFSPNADGHNDVLHVQGICLQTMSFMIFNRWGEKVFETTDQKHGWDGSYKGEQLNTGVFVYRLEGKTYDGKAYSSKGNITLVR